MIGSEAEHEDTAMPIAAIRLEFNFLVERLAFGEITMDEFLGAAKEFLCFDGEGVAWAISLENGNWYKFVGEEPVLGEPPEVLYGPLVGPLEEQGETAEEETAVEPPKKGKARNFCTGCGNPLEEGERFCSKCGREV